MPSPLEQFDQLRSNSKFIYLVYYRGHWCPFCQNWLKSFSTISPSIKAAGGEPIIITAEANPDHLAIMRDKTGYKDTAILDPTNELVTELKKQDWVDVAITSKSNYPNGMAQPGVLVLSKDRKVMYSWAIKPGMANIGGAKDRPSLVEIWEDVDAELQGQAPVHSGMYSKQTFFQGISTKLFG